MNDIAAHSTRLSYYRNHLLTKMLKLNVLFVFCFFFHFAHTNNYNTLHLQFITGNCHRLQKRNKKTKKDKAHKITIVCILTIKRP